MKTLLTLGLSIVLSVATAQEPTQADYYEDGSVKAEYFVQADNTVKAKFYYSSGQLKEVGTFKEYKRHGEWTSYSRSGQVTAKGSFNGGLKSGIWMFWNFDGVLSHEVDYTGEQPKLVVHNEE